MVKTDLNITVVGMGLIGGSLFKAARRAGYNVKGLEKNDQIDVSQTDILLLALPSEIIPDWFARYAPSLKTGAVTVDTCGIKSEICRRLRDLVPPGCTFVGGHPMAGREVSGLAYADANLFQNASMLLTPYADTDAQVLEELRSFFASLGFGKVLVTTPEHHDKMIAFTSQLGHVIAASYTQDQLSAEAAGYAAGSYANMTRIASMVPDAWDKLFSGNKEHLLEVLDRFMQRVQTFREALANEDHAALREFIAAGAKAKANDKVARSLPQQAEPSATLGKYLKLSVFGASHAPAIGMRLEHFPDGFRLNRDKLQALMDRRAPGRDSLSTARRESDIPQFKSGFNADLTTGETIEAVIPNTDIRPADYGPERTIPRPGHADFTQWIQDGRIPTGGGPHSGRMTAPICLAGGICLQWLELRGIQVTGHLVAAGGNADNPEAQILAAKNDGDSVGGIVEITVTGLPPGLGGPLFQGVETEIAQAIFSIPGVKGLEFGDGFALATRRGSQTNDAFIIKDGQVATASNHAGGLLGGITTGMPLVFRLAMKPTPSIFQTQQSVDLAARTAAPCQIKGRHDPCIARRAIPVAEALTGFVLADLLLDDEAKRPRLCLTLTEPTVAQALAVLKDNQPFVEMCELRADFLTADQHAAAADFPRQAGLPVILTLRRPQDGGRWEADEEQRANLFRKLLANAAKPFVYVDFEDDFRRPDLEALARERGTKIIRSLHDFHGPVENIVERACALRGSSDDIPKIACRLNHCSELTRLFRETADFTGFPHIICGMGELGKATRILAVKTHSLLTFTSPAKAEATLASLGHLTPATMVRTYRFRSLTAATQLYAVTGWPLEHSLSPELNNEAFAQDAWPAVMVPLPAETAAEVLQCAETLGVRGIAVTVPHKTAILSLMASVSPAATAINAVNTVIMTVNGWHGENTDIAGFRQALTDFLGRKELRSSRVAILGAGGAANAVAYVIAELGAEACVFNRTLTKAQALAEKYGFRAAALAPENADLLAKYSQIIIQTTSVGLSSLGDSQDCHDPIPFYDFRGDESVFDLIYSPPVTPLMARAQAAGCRTTNGLPMLIAQAQEQRRLYKELARS